MIYTNIVVGILHIMINIGILDVIKIVLYMSITTIITLIHYN